MTSYPRFLARIPTNQYGYVEVAGDDEAEFRANLDDFSNTVGELVQALANGDGAGDLSRNTQPDEVVETDRPEPEPEPERPQRRAKSNNNSKSGSYGRKKQVSNARGGGEPPRCDHGKMRYYDSGSWKAYFCPLEKGDPDQCDPEWIDD